MSDPSNIDGINSVGPLKTGYVGYRDSFPDMPAFGTEYDQDRMSLPFDSSGSFQSDQDIFSILASAYPSESAEQIANRLGSLTANTAMARQFGGAALDPYSQLTATTTPPAASTITPPASSTNDGILDNILGGAKSATKAVAGVIDSGLQILGDILGMGDPSVVVLNPTSPNATVVYGTPTGSPATIIGTMPKSGAPVGVITGIPAVDELLAGIFNQRGQGGKSTEQIIRDVLLGKIGEATGYPVAGVAGAIEGGLAGKFEDIVDSATRVVLELDKKLENEVGVDPYSVIPKANIGEVDPYGPQNKVPDVVTPPPEPPPEETTPKVIPTPYEMVAGDAGTFNVADGGPQNKVPNVVTPPPEPPPEETTPKVIPLPEETPPKVIPLPEETPPKVIPLPEETPPEETTPKVIPLPEKIPPEKIPPKVIPPPLPPVDVTEEIEKILGTVGTGGGGVVAPVTPAPSQGMRGMKTEQAGVADLGEGFDLSSLSLANVLRALSGEDDNTTTYPYYGGGSVDTVNSSLDDIIRLLRGK